MRTLKFGSKHFEAGLAAFCAAAAAPRDIVDAVAGILADVRSRGDEAVLEYAAKFDGARFGPSRLRVAAGELSAAARALPAADRRAMEAARQAIVAFNRRGGQKGWTARNSHGATVGEKFDPIRRVGIYVPGGQVPLVSTALMTITLARIAGCPEIAVFTPATGEGLVAPALLAAIKLAGASEVYRVGGVQAIGAMAYGTNSIRPVDKLFGPGNAYVCEAKRQVFGTVGVDSLPGPSEVMVVADRTARPEFAAADLLAQAEHGSGREKIYLVAIDRGVIAAIESELKIQLAASSRRGKIERVLAEGFLAVEVTNAADAAIVANYVAPEHLELLVKPSLARQLAKAVTTAGAIMVGDDTPTVLGDFAAGPSHVLPTARTGRFFSGLRVADFVRRTSLIQYNRAALRKAEPVTSAFAAMERLEAHGRSATIRL